MASDFAQLLVEFGKPVKNLRPRFQIPFHRQSPTKPIPLLKHLDLQIPIPHRCLRLAVQALKSHWTFPSAHRTRLGCASETGSDWVWRQDISFPQARLTSLFDRPVLSSRLCRFSWRCLGQRRCSQRSRDATLPLLRWGAQMKSGTSFRLRVGLRRNRSYTRATSRPVSARSGSGTECPPLFQKTETLRRGSENPGGSIGQ